MFSIRHSACAGAALGFLALSALPAATAPAAAASAKSFDGKWSVLIVTEKGTCDRGYRYGVQIDNGTVKYAGEASFTVTGNVKTDGAIVVKVSRGEQSALGSGKLDNTSGGGTWKAGECSGSWTAEKRS